MNKIKYAEYNSVTQYGSIDFILFIDKSYCQTSRTWTLMCKAGRKVNNVSVSNVTKVVRCVLCKPSSIWYRTVHATLFDIGDDRYEEGETGMRKPIDFFTKWVGAAIIIEFYLPQ